MKEQIINDSIMRNINLNNNTKILNSLKYNIISDKTNCSWSIGDNFNHFFNLESKFNKDLDVITISPKYHKINACIWLKASFEGITICGIHDINGEKLDSDSFDTVLNSFINDCIKKSQACDDIIILVDETNDNLI